MMKMTISLREMRGPLLSFGPKKELPKPKEIKTTSNRTNTRNNQQLIISFTLGTTLKKKIPKISFANKMHGHFSN